jgi:hypothetical protein
MGFMANLLAKGQPFSRVRLTEASRVPEPVATLLLTTRWQ